MDVKNIKTNENRDWIFKKLPNFEKTNNGLTVYKFLWFWPLKSMKQNKNVHIYYFDKIIWLEEDYEKHKSSVRV